MYPANWPDSHKPGINLLLGRAVFLKTLGFPDDPGFLPHILHLYLDLGYVRKLTMSDLLGPVNLQARENTNAK